ncbi:GNAT family N-acetyltransferase [Chryseobacterium vrystaatense]|uniref:GNAT family acetyltransferase n=1 Tax=Chryseobacterium vrystaatense TaxID=307480 RepID=A0ABR4UQ91_9FLAO|nr:GNAT family N-acetyltransferase [Chryseobacterium vrystaatense]KFF27124.1 GNAT family acetyltransferase [Chryseobacterium vrystaatense]
MIQLKTYNRKQLREFISSGDFQKYDFLPITRHRAESHIKNPKASDDQTLLILAFHEEKLAGYVGCFPDNFIIDGKEFSYAWLSTLYVNSEFREKRVPKKLLKKVFEEYKDRIAITEFTREAEALYTIMGVFEDVFPKEGKRYYFQTDAAKMIPGKKPETKALTPLFRIVDTTANSLIALKNSWVKKPKIRFEILDQIDAESSDFISKFQSRRSADEINVFINNPWVLEGKKDGKYLFSSYSETFKYFWIKVYDDNNVFTSCSLLLLRDEYLKIPYLYSEFGLDHFIDFLNYFIVKNKVKALTSYHKELNIHLDTSKAFPKIYKRHFKREYLFHKQLLNDLPKGFDPHYQDGDGDCMMT